MILDWFIAYWKLAREVLTHEDIEEICSYKSVTPELMAAILRRER